MIGVNFVWGRFLAAALALAGTFVGMSATPALAAPGSAEADTEIVTRLSLIKDDDLFFGSIIRGTTAGTVTIAPSGARTATGGVTLVPSTFQPARFAGYGRNNQSVQISMSANSITLDRVGGGATMTVDTWIIGSTPTAQLSTVPLVFTISSSTGIFNFPLGATLRVGANQPSGTYTGTFSVTVNYL